MDQGVIQSLKEKCCSLAIKRQIDVLENGNQLPKFSILIAMSILEKAWNFMPEGTFKNCFKKTGIPKKSMKKVLNDADDPFASVDVKENVMESLKDGLEMMKEKFNENYGMRAEKLVDIDFEISVTRTSSDADTVTEVSGHIDIDDKEEVDGEEQPTDCISKPVLERNKCHHRS